MSLTKVSYAMINGEVSNVLDFGAVGDGVTDNISAFIAAIASGNPVFVPAGTYILSQQLILQDKPGIFGDSGGGTILNFKNVTGLDTTYRGAITTKGTANPANATGGYPVVQNLTIEATGTIPSDFNGVQLSYRSIVKEVKTTGFTANGFLIDGINGNANSCYLEKCTAYHCNQGFVAQGDDGNACVFMNCTSFGPTNASFYDGSLYGNTYIGCEGGYGGTTVYSVSYNEINLSQFIGCYAEAGTTSQQEWQVPGQCVIISPMGAQPVYIDSTYRNSAIRTASLRGWCSNDDLTFTRNFDAFTFGSSTYRAAKTFDGGVYIRGLGDGAIYQLVTQGANVNGNTTYEGVTMWKDTTPQIWFGHFSGRPHFLSGFMADLPTSAAGLPTGTIWVDPGAGNVLKRVP